MKAALVASAEKVAYVAVKHGVVGTTKVAAIELANSASRSPGGTDAEHKKHQFLLEKQPMVQFSTTTRIGYPGAVPLF